MPKAKWTPLHVDDAMNGDRVIYGNGEVRRDIEIYPTKEQYELLKQGYMCIRCFELQSEAFPETCGMKGCDGYPDGFPMRERQRDVMETEMYDEVRQQDKPSVIWTPGKD